MKQDTTNWIGNIATIAGVVVGGIVVARVIRKQTLAAEIRKDHPEMTYHQSILTAFERLGYDKHPFKV